MPKKNSSWGQNTKATEARERRAEKKRNEDEVRQNEKENATWIDPNKHLERKQQKKASDAQKKQEALKRKQETKELLEAEEAKLSLSSAKAPGSTKKVTRSEIDVVREKERKEQEKANKEKELAKKRITENLVIEEENPNRKMAQMLEEEDAVEARDIDDALRVLNINNGVHTPVDIHPEKRLKAAYKEYSNRELPELRAENPGLKLSQLKQILWKEWQKSPENPLNQR